VVHNMSEISKALSLSKTNIQQTLTDTPRRLDTLHALPTKLQSELRKAKMKWRLLLVSALSLPKPSAWVEWQISSNNTE